MTTTIYKWTDASAPSLSGSVGSLTALLSACLVDGYGAKVNAGWTKPFTGTNGASFLQGTGSNGFYVNVNDNAPGTGGARNARVRGYETMTAFDTGTNLFPTAAQFANGLFVRKSTTADTTIREWLVAADSRTFYVFVRTADVAQNWVGWYFGEFYSFKPTTDNFRTGLWAGSAENSFDATTDPLYGSSITLGTTTGVSGSGRSLARSYTGVAGAVSGSTTSVIIDRPLGIGGAAGTIVYTNAADNKEYLYPLRITENSAATTGSMRGRFRGLWGWSHPTNTVADGDTFSGSGDLAGRTFVALKFWGTSTNAVLIIETSSTWDSN